MSSFISNITGGGDDKKTIPEKASNTDLMTSAKQWAESAQNAAGDQSEKVAAGATELLEAAKKSGSDGSSAAAEYLKQAKDYLQEYEKKAVAATPAVEKKEEGFGAGAMKAAGDLFKK